MKKIAIIGSSGSGKTTLAKKLATRLNLPLYHLDHYFWLPHWQEVSHEEFAQKQHELVKQDAWIIDGSFRRTLSIRLDAADTIIFVDTSRLRCLYRVIKRQIMHWGSNRPDMPIGCKTMFDKGFFKFLWDIWTWQTDGGRQIIMDYLAQANKTGSARVYHLKSPKEIDAFLASLD